jgi:SAM-dependent methyltransferase
MADQSLAPSRIMMDRNACISCGSDKLDRVASGRFGDEPLRGFIAADPWGVDPLPILANETWMLVRCGACDQMFHRFVLNTAMNAERFSTWMNKDAIEAFEACHGGGNNARTHVAHLLRIQDRHARPRLLDFGCGSGQFLEMARLFGIECVGVDRSADRRKIAGFEIAHELDDVTGNFDVISMFEVLEHLDDPRAIVAALSARLNSGGMMIIEVPDCSGVTGITNVHDYRVVHPLDHINAFTPGTLTGFMTRAGFKPLRKQPAFVSVTLTTIAKAIAKPVVRRSTTQMYFERA